MVDERAAAWPVDSVDDLRRDLVGDGQHVQVGTVVSAVDREPLEAGQRLLMVGPRHRSLAAHRRGRPRVEQVGVPGMDIQELRMLIRYWSSSMMLQRLAKAARLLIAWSWFQRSRDGLSSLACHGANAR